MGTLAILGVSSFLFALILTPLVRDAFLRWNVVELDSCDTDMLTAVRDSYQYLVGKGLARGNRAVA